MPPALLPQNLVHVSRQRVEDEDYGASGSRLHLRHHYHPRRQGEACRVNLYLLAGADEAGVLVLDEGFSLQATFGSFQCDSGQHYRVSPGDNCAQ
jgi:hypothetical protein